MDDSQQHMSHRVTIDARKRISLTGVKDVQSFDDKMVMLETSMGILGIKGNELHVNRLSLEKGEVDIQGRLDIMEYTEKKEEKTAGSILGRLFG